MEKRQLKEYRIWKAMKARCYAPSQSKHGYYQADGIQVCDRWLNSFDNFLADMGRIPFEDASIERIDYLGDYCPENCKWIHQSEQPKNRRNSRFYTLGDKTMCLRDWAREYGINYHTLIRRIKAGMPFEEALTAPIKELCECNSKAVVQYTLDGERIAEFPSAVEASKQTGAEYSGISRCCLGNSQTCGGFKWKHANSK